MRRDKAVQKFRGDKDGQQIRVKSVLKLGGARVPKQRGGRGYPKVREGRVSKLLRRTRVPKS